MAKSRSCFGGAAITGLLLSMLLSGCASEGVGGDGPTRETLVRIEESVRPLTDAETAIRVVEMQRGRCESLIAELSRPNESVVRATASDFRDSRAERVWSDAWVSSLGELVAHPSASVRLDATARVIDLLAKSHDEAGREAWRACLRDVLGIELQLLNGAYWLARREAPPSGSVEAAARSRVENFMADGPSVISGRDGRRVTATELGGGVPGSRESVARAEILAARLRRLRVCLAMARPEFAEAAGAPVRPRAGAGYVVERAGDDELDALARADALRLLGRSSASALGASQRAARLAESLLPMLDDAYFVRGERIFASFYRDWRAQALALASRE